MVEARTDKWGGDKLKGDYRILYWALVALLLFFLMHSAYINRSEETFEPDGQVYRPSGAAEGYPSGIRIEPEELLFEMKDGYDTLYGLHIDTLMEDGDAFESAIHIGEGWDCHISTKDGCLTFLPDGTQHWTFREDPK